MASSPSTPATPSYSSPASYSSPGSYNAAPSTSQLEALFPTASYPNAYNLANQAQGADEALGQLSLYQNPVTQPNAEQAYTKQYYDTYLAPQIASDTSNLFSQGALNSSSGGAQIGEETAQAAAQAGLQGQQYYTQALNNFLNERQSFFSGDVPLAENAASGQLQATQANQGVASQLAQDQFQAPQLSNAYNLASSQNQNQYNLGTSQLANNYNLGQYGTQASIYENQANNATAINKQLLSGK